ncbi:MAG: cytochrome c oxidase accessory protein CcoG [Calditrichaceae bacterium]|nr:cytochrome c oxidase accessory protein CcoG [Calditrichia bacterium]NUQ39968.1 cytochrome c oxidase accessory protein CcoG [Calditrichaceae bacterium]
MSSEIKAPESFRDKVSTIDEQGKRIWIYPKKPRGPLHRARAAVSILLLAFLFAAPFIKVNGQPLILLNVLERKFILFGLAFWPQDLHLFALTMIALIVFIILFTAVFGRLWCGWACPQIVFMEMVFRKIEYWIEGDAHQQRALNKAPWSAGKFVKKASKHAVFYGLSFLIGNILLAYIIGVEELFKIITDPPGQHVAGLTAMILFSGLFYFIFAYFREQACTMVCPYGRLQGVLLDPNSIVVMYDFQRGEPRGKIKKGAERVPLGHCVECRLCVQVCPTGIDIRDGTQLECVNCAACIDACNEVMERVNFPKGLIRYASFNGVKSGEKLKITPRIVGYSALLLALVGLLSFLLLTRSAIEATILRTPGVLYQEVEEGKIQNLYNLKVANKSFDRLSVHLKLLEPPGEILLVGGEQLNVPEDGLAESVFFVKLPRAQLRGVQTPLRIGVYDGERLLETVKTGFLGPAGGR